MSKECYIRLILGVYKVTELFPEKEPLKNNIRKLADEILVSLLTGQYENGSRMIEGMNKLLDLAENRRWADPRNFLVLRREYAEISQFLEKKGINSEKTVDNSFRNSKNKQRQEVILDILKNNGKVKISDLSKSFPALNRRTLLRDLGIFCQAGMIERSGTGRGACYNVRNATL